MRVMKIKIEELRKGDFISIPLSFLEVKRAMFAIVCKVIHMNGSAVRINARWSDTMEFFTFSVKKGSWIAVMVHGEVKEADLS